MSRLNEYHNGASLMVHDSGTLHYISRHPRQEVTQMESEKCQDIGRLGLSLGVAPKSSTDVEISSMITGAIEIYNGAVAQRPNK